MKNLVLFDMDGTLTPARKRADSKMLAPLLELSKLADIGIVTGSDIDFVIEQCSHLWDGINTLNPERIDIMPCNGTKLYRFENSSWNKISDVDMKNQIGDRLYQKLIRTLVRSQCFIMEDSKTLGDFPVSARFITYRSSLLNWSLIGRDAHDSERERFIEFDKSFSIRYNVKEYLELNLDKDVLEKIEIATGGDTSIDIYPKGWNKTYALRHCNANNIWFVGDNCDPGGNDHALYAHLKSTGRSFKTKSPEDTINIIRNKIIPSLL